MLMTLCSGPTGLGRAQLPAGRGQECPQRCAVGGDVVGLRRARIGAEGDLGPDSRYVGEIDLASGSVVPRDVYVAFGARNDGGKPRTGRTFNRDR